MRPSTIESGHARTGLGLVAAGLAAATVAAMATLGLAGLAGPAGASADAQLNASVSPVTASAAPALTAAAAEAMFTADGIVTVSSESSHTPLHAVSLPAGLTFTSNQVSAMAAEASGGLGLLGSSLDGVATAGSGQPPVAYLLAAWVATGTSPGAAEVRSLMGAGRWTAQQWSQAPKLAFPTIALPLFTADIVRAEQGRAGGAGGASHAHIRAATALVERALGTEGLVDAPCTLVSNFMQEVLDTVFEHLRLGTVPGGSVLATIGSFFVNLWNTAVSFAQSVITGLVKAVSATVVGKIAGAAAAAATVAEVVSEVAPWTARVVADPGTVQAGGAGAFSLTISAGGGVDYPAAVQDCANALGITLPSLAPKNAPASWSLSGPLRATSDLSVKLDEKGSSQVTYSTPATTSSSSSCTSQTGRATVTVSRPAVQRLKSLVDGWLTSAIGAAGSLVKPILQPLVDQMSTKLDSLTQLTGSATVEIRSSGSSGSGDSCPCIVGTWTMQSETVSVGAFSATGGRGSRWTFSGAGQLTVDYDGSEPFVAAGGEVKITYSGSSTGAYTVLSDNDGSGSWQLIPKSSSVVATTDVAGTTARHAVPVDSSPEDGTYTCTATTLTTTSSVAKASLVRQAA